MKYKTHQMVYCVTWNLEGLHDKVRLLKDSMVMLAVKAGIEFHFLTNIST